MPKIIPFEGVRYNSGKIKRLSRVVAPPYDVIPPEMQDKLYLAHPNNVVRLILNKIGKGDTAKSNRYTRAAKFFNSWLRDKILVQDAEKSFYIYSQAYTYNGKRITRTGFVGLMELDMTGKHVLPHENTLAAPKTDRLNLLREVRANLSPIFVLYDDKTRKLVTEMTKFASKNKPVIDVNFEGVQNRMWKLSDKAAIKNLERFMADKDIFIADGHHRYEVARMYAKEIVALRMSGSLKKSAKYLMVYFVESGERMLTVLPAHRLVKDIGQVTAGGILKRLERCFAIEKAKDLGAMMSKLGKSGPHSFGIYNSEAGFHIVRLKDLKESDNIISGKPKAWRRLDVSILHLFILQHLLGISDDDDNIEFVKDPAEAARAVKGGKFKIAFFLNPTKITEVKEIARLGERMPRKATYFYPKPLSGLVINKLAG